MQSPVPDITTWTKIKSNGEAITIIGQFETHPMPIFERVRLPGLDGKLVCSIGRCELSEAHIGWAFSMKKTAV
jgi:hypothetical protein